MREDLYMHSKDPLLCMWLTCLSVFRASTFLHNVQIENSWGLEPENKG